jgi:hypothetical protein
LRTPHLATAVAGLTDTPARKAGQALRSSAEQEGVVAVEASAPRTLHAQTVHDLKGESRDVVLVVADRLRSGGVVPKERSGADRSSGRPFPPRMLRSCASPFVALTRALPATFTY